MTQELDALLARIEDPTLRADLTRHIDQVRAKRQFGLVFEGHMPETVKLPSHPVRRGTVVTRRAGDTTDAWVVERVASGQATIVAEGQEPATVPVSDLVVLAEFGTPIYPGLKPVGSVRRGGDKPAHVVVNGENHHALEALQFTHAGKVDCIYIDPPYNTGARDWKYNNDYVDADDGYRHSKWLAFMERRLLLAKELLDREDSVLIVTIDEKEHLRLGLLLEQSFPEATIQMVTSNIKPSGSQRAGEFSRVEEYLFFVMFGDARPADASTDMLRDGTDPSSQVSVTWHGLRRRGSTDWRRSHRPNGFYPIFVDAESSRLHSVGEPLAPAASRTEVVPPTGTFAAWPLDPAGEEGRWQISPQRLRSQLDEGSAVLRSADTETGSASVLYLKGGDLRRLREGELKSDGFEPDGRIRVLPAAPTRRAKTMWLMESHDASAHGTALLTRFVGDRRFPFPKSLYAVEDALRFFVGGKPEAVVLDFFAGSGTTAHALMRLNKQDGGRRQCISVTNNEVSADEQRRLRQDGLRPGDPEWEALGIFAHITKPRIEAAITGRTPDGDPIRGDYRFTDEFPMAEGFEETAEFFELTYQDAQRVELDLAFEAVAPLLWMRAGSEGPIVDQRTNDQGVALPFAFGVNYGVLFDPDDWRLFIDGLSDQVSTVFVVTDSTTVFSAVSAELPAGVEPVRLYQNYLSTFEINRGGQ